MQCLPVVVPAGNNTIVGEGEGILSSVRPAILPIDLVNIFLNKIRENQREPDGLLHCSSHILKPLRFVQLEMAGDIPVNPRPIAQDIRLASGTIWHDWFHSVIADTGIEFLYEIPLDRWLPEGWGGTADWLFKNPDSDAWVLGDLKTIRGEGLFFINRDGARPEHMWQLSAYWHALADSGVPLVKGFGILYWPMNDTNDKVEILPTIQDCLPIERDEVHAHMSAVKASVDAYLEAYRATGKWDNPHLAPMPEREQRYYWNAGQKVFDVKLVPNWYESVCEFSEEYCPRSSSEKVGHYLLDGTYVPRKGYEATVPTVRPTEVDFGKRRNR